MLYVKAAGVAFVVFVVTQVVMLWKLFTPMSSTRATGTGALQAYMARSIPVGLVLFALTLFVILLTRRHAH